MNKIPVDYHLKKAMKAKTPYEYMNHMTNFGIQNGIQATFYIEKMINAITNTQRAYIKLFSY